MMFKHLKEKNVSYLNHARFALGIGLRLACSSIMFVLHAILPIIPIPYMFNLESTGLYLFEKDNSLSD